MNVMRFKKEWLQQKWFGNTIAICAGVVLFVLLEHLGAIFGVIGSFFRFLSPVVIGAAIAYVIDPLARLFEHYLFGNMKKWQLRRMLAVILALLLILVLVITLMTYLVPQLAGSISQFIDNLDGYSQSFKNFIHGVGDKFPKLPIDADKVTGWIDDLMNNLVKWVSDNKELLLSKGLDFGSGLITFLLGLILAIYFLFGKYFMLAGTKRFMRATMKERKYNAALSFFSRCNRIMTRYVAFDVLDGIIIGLANGIFMWIMGMPYAVLISFVVGVTNLAPTFGPLVGAVIGGLILLLVNPLDALIFLIFTLALQTVDGYILKPRLFGNSLGVSSVVILVFIIVGGRMFGIMGVLLSIPLAAITDFVYHDYILLRLERRKGISDGNSETPESESQKAHEEMEERSKEKSELRETRKQEREEQKEEQRREERRQGERRQGERRKGGEPPDGIERRKGDRRQGNDRRKADRRNTAEEESGPVLKDDPEENEE